MPSIDVAMVRSLRGGVTGILARSLEQAFVRRSIISDAESNITDVKTAFSSWDNCMAAVYCKWPVIAVIIIGGLIIFSVIWCIARCLCCGLSCCCECCYCLKCCGQCCGCCDPPKGGRHKHLDPDQPYKNIGPAEHGYQREDPMSFHRPTPAAKVAEPPQYASFDVSRDKETAVGGEDSLPAMPTWGDSESKKIEVATEAVELQQLKPEAINHPNSPAAPLMNGMSPAATPGTRSPAPQGGASPYGGPPGGGYMGPANGYGQHQQGFNNGQVHGAYGQSTTSFQTEQSWGVTNGPAYGQQGYGQGHAYGAQHAGYTNEPDDIIDQYSDPQGFNNPPPAPYGAPQQQQPPYGINRSMTGGSSPAAMMGPRGSPAPQRSLTGGSSPVPSQGQFAHERNFDPRIAPARTYSPAPSQQGQFAGPGGVTAPGRTFSPAPMQGGGAPPPQRTYSPAPMQGGAPGRTYSPAPNGRGPPPPRQWSGDAAGPGPQRTYSPSPMGPQGGPRGGPGMGRAPPQRQYSNDTVGSQRQFSGDRPGMGGRGPSGNRPPPIRQYTNGGGDVPPGPRSPNFSRPTRSNTFDQQQQQQQPQVEDRSDAAYPGYKPYQPGR